MVIHPEAASLRWLWSEGGRFAGFAPILVERSGDRPGFGSIGQLTISRPLDRPSIEQDFSPVRRCC
jgi:hypothetical protein